MENIENKGKIDVRMENKTIRQEIIFDHIK
jgi:hypothetical protein